MTSHKVISEFRQWQQDSKRHIARPSDDRHHCQCCESDFTGNFCPQCGQKAGVGRITWRTLRQGFAMLWGMDSRSLPYTLWQLLLRPGYLIGDYISGRRQVSFPPIKMLAIVALFALIINNFLMTEEVNKEVEIEPLMFNSLFSFFENHYDAAVMFFFSMLIIPTYYIFRFAPRHGHLNLPEVFFVQVFNSTIALVLFMLAQVIDSFCSERTNTIQLIFFLFIILTIYRSYHQLFGYSYWSTLWRVVAIVLAAGLTFLALVDIDFIRYFTITGNHSRALENLTTRLTPYLLGAVIAIAMPYIISRRTAKQQ